MMFSRKVNASNGHILDQLSNSIIKKLFYLNIRNFLKFGITFVNKLEILPSWYQNWYVYVTFESIQTSRLIYDAVHPLRLR